MRIRRISTILAMSIGAAIAGFIGISTVGALTAESTEPASTGITLEKVDRDAVMDTAMEIAVDLGNDEQLEALADRIVTADEYAHATNHAIECLQRSGFVLDGVGRDWSGLAYAYGFEGPEGGDASYDACYNVHVAAVDMAYQLLSEDQRVQILDKTIDCLDAQSVDVSEARHQDGSMAHPSLIQRSLDPTDTESWDRCVEAARSEIDAEPLPRLAVEE